MDEILEVETESGGLVLLDPFLSELLGPQFGSQLAIVMGPREPEDEARDEEDPFALAWLTAAEPLADLHEQGQFQMVLTGEGVFHTRVTDERHQLRSKAETSMLCGPLRIESGQLVLADGWPNPENRQDLVVPPGQYHLWLHTMAIPPEVTRTVGVFGTDDSPFLAIELSQEPPRDAPVATFPPRVQMPEDAWEPAPDRLCRATVRRSEGDFLLLDLHRSRQATMGSGRMMVRPGERLRPDDRVLVRLLSEAHGYWNVELHRRL
jgi:hypothetical protein